MGRPFSSVLLVLSGSGFPHRKHRGRPEASNPGCGPLCLRRRIFNSKAASISRTTPSNRSGSCSFAACSQSSSQSSLISACTLYLQIRNGFGKGTDEYYMDQTTETTPTEAPFHFKQKASAGTARH